MPDKLPGFSYITIVYWSTVLIYSFSCFNLIRYKTFSETIQCVLCQFCLFEILWFDGIISSYYMSGFYYIMWWYYYSYFVLYFAYITFYFIPNSSKKSVFCKLDMIRLLFCVLTNVLSSLCIICVLSCYNKLLCLCLKLSNYYFGIQIWYCTL